LYESLIYAEIDTDSLIKIIKNILEKEIQAIPKKKIMIKYPMENHSKSRDGINSLYINRNILIDFFTYCRKKELVSCGRFSY
jgi:flagellar biosynthesis regulator FlaF